MHRKRRSYHAQITIGTALRVAVVVAVLLFWTIVYIGGKRSGPWWSWAFDDRGVLAFAFFLLAFALTVLVIVSELRKSRRSLRARRDRLEAPSSDSTMERYDHPAPSSKPRVRRR
mgnify:CR=1 FL=1